MKNVVKFAIVGCGHIGSRHAIEIQQYGQLIAVCDTDKLKATTFAAKYQCNAFFTIEDLVKANLNINLIAICTPNWLHASQSIICLKNGYHVLCEKPMAINTKEAHNMVAIAEQTNRKLFVVKQNRYNPPVEFVKSLISLNKLGRLYSFQVNAFWHRPEAYYQGWRGKIQTDGGTLYTQFSHFIDLILWFFGNVKQANLIKANYSHPYIEFEDSGIVQLEMQSGAIGGLNYSVNTYQNNMEGSITLLAEKGTIKIGGQYLNELEYFKVADIKKPNLPMGRGPNKYDFYQGSMSNHNQIYSNVIEALKDINHPLLQATEAIATIQLIEELYNR